MCDTLRGISTLFRLLFTDKKFGQCGNTCKPVLFVLATCDGVYNWLNVLTCFRNDIETQKKYLFQLLAMSLCVFNDL